jgi:hypothetical protein
LPPPHGVNIPFRSPAGNRLAIRPAYVRRALSP